MAQKFDFCVLGGSPAGQYLASRMAAAGYKTALVGDVQPETERPLLAALQKAASVYHNMLEARIYGLQATVPPVHYPLVRDYLLKQIANVPPVGRLAYTHIQGDAQFVSPSKVKVEGETISATRFALDPPLRMRRPEMAGIADVPVLTPDNLFGLPDLPHNLIIIGGGPSGAAFAQAFARLGSRVHLLTRGVFLKHFDEEFRGLLKQQLYGEGITIVEDVALNTVAPADGGLFLSYTSGKADHHLRGSHILLATGRAPDWSLLDLPKAKLDPAKFTGHSLNTTNPHIFSLATAPAHHNPHLAAFAILAKMGHRAPDLSPDLMPHQVHTRPGLIQIGQPNAGMQRYQDLSGRKLWTGADGKLAAMASLSENALADMEAGAIAIAEGWTLAKLATVPGPLGQLAAHHAKPPAKRGLFG